jgi:hypothetical protein
MAARARGALGAHRAARLGDSVTALAGFTNAVDLFSEMGTRFARAVVVLEQAEWLASEGRTEEARACAADARATFERLKAMPGSNASTDWSAVCPRLSSTSRLNHPSRARKHSVT